jgi:outer membrane protein OmpA-like peptidoglycan-associated protein
MKRKMTKSEINKVTFGIDAQREAAKEERRQLVKAEKDRIRKMSEERAENMDAHVTFSFDSYRAKALFMQRFGYSPQEKFIKGEVFNSHIERID